MLTKRPAREVAASDSTVTSDDIPEIRDRISHTHLTLTTAGRYTWVWDALDVMALQTRDRSDTQSLAYICAVNDLCRKYTYLPRPAELPPSREVCGIRKRLQPGAKLYRDANRCSNCIKGKRNTKHEWIGCWSDGGRCAACSMAKTAFCKFPLDAVDDAAAIPTPSVSADGPPVAKRPRIVLKIPVQVTSEPAEPGAQPDDKEVQSDDKAAQSEAEAVRSEGKVVGLPPKKGWTAGRIVANLLRYVIGATVEPEDNVAREGRSVAEAPTFEPEHSPASQEEGRLDTSDESRTKIEDTGTNTSPTRAEGTTAIKVEEGGQALGIRLAVEWDRVYRSLEEAIRGGEGATTLLFKDAMTFGVTIRSMATSQLGDRELAEELYLALHQWDRVHHYLEHVIRLKDPAMNALCLEDAALVEESVKKIVAAVTSA